MFAATKLERKTVVDTLKKATRSSFLMKFTDYVFQRNVILLESDTKAGAIEELAARMKKSRMISDVDEVVRLVFERESLETTGIGRGIAIPHTRCAAAKKLACAVGMCKTPIDFHAFDGKKTQFIFLTVYPHKDTQKYLHFISILARVFAESKYRKLVRSAKTPEELYTVLGKCDEELILADEKKAGAIQSGDLPVDELANKRVDLVLLIRLQRLCLIKASRKRPSKELLMQIEQLRSCVEPTVLDHFDKLSARPGGVAVVGVEGEVCQGCHMKVPAQIVQDLRETDHVHTCPMCRRFIFDAVGM